MSQGKYHECLEVRAPPLREAVPYFPVIVFACWHVILRDLVMRIVQADKEMSAKTYCLRSCRSEPVVEPLLQTILLILSGLKVIAWPEKGQLKKQVPEAKKDEMGRARPSFATSGVL
jgi:hypothetical protein